MSLGDTPISTMKVSADFHILQILIKKIAVLGQNCFEGIALCEIECWVF